MQELEKILKEIEQRIEKAKKIIVEHPSDKMDEIANDTAEAFIEAYKECQDIIRKHMNDSQRKDTFEFDFSGVKSFDCQCGRHYVNTADDRWISVDERLPEVFGKYWATIRYDDGRISEPVVVDFRGVRQKYVVDTPNGREYETWCIDSAFRGSRVIAWKPYYIPEPYRPERSEE